MEDKRKPRMIQAWYDTVAGMKGVGIQIYPHIEGEECYSEGGCSLFFTLDQLKDAGIDPDDLVRNYKDYDVIYWGDGEYLIRRTR
jgi:hypothetical protein